MSALTDLFTALATKIRSKTGGSNTYTPPQMVNAIDDVYQAGVDAGETTHTRTYTPVANTAANDMGVTHDYRYVNTSGMIVPSGAKNITANGTGIDVSSYATANVNVSGTSITPSNSSPASMTQGETYTPTANGKAVESVTDITPSNTSPPALSAGNIYKPGSSGYAIGSYSNISPSSSGTYFSSGMKKMSSSGYAYSSIQTTGIVSEGCYLLFSTSTPVSETQYTIGSSFRVNQPSGAIKGAIINCKGSSATSIKGGDATNTCYIIGIKNNKVTSITTVTNNSVSLTNYDYLIIVPSGGKTFTFS